MMKMTLDLEAINYLSHKFEKTVENLERSDLDRVIFLNERIIEQGEKVLRMYDSELAKAPSDEDVLMSYSKHLFRMGYMYYDAIHFRFLPTNKPLVGGYLLGRDAKNYAENACSLLSRSFEVIPSAKTAFILADIFRLTKFYGTALFWFDIIEQSVDGPDLLTRAKAQWLDMQADGKLSDPLIAHKSAFPTRTT